MIGPVKKFFLACSGADLRILERPECEIEHNKYVGIGATILSTALLASFSGGYAMYTAFDSYPISFCLGLLWGAIIFNLDRYIVSTLRKRRPPPGACLRVRAGLKVKEVLTALPRLLLAIFISVVITRPIELRLFDSAIQDQIKETANAREATGKERIKQKHFDEIRELKAQEEQLRQEVRDKEAQRDRAFEQSMSEAVGERGPLMTGEAGKGPVYRERLDELQKAEARLKETRETNEARLAFVTGRLNELQADEDRLLGDTVNTIREDKGLLTRLEALSDLSRRPAVWFASLFLIILFGLLETAPIFVKLITDRGPYEDIYETLEQGVFVREQKKILELIDEANTEWTLKAETSARRRAAEMELARRTLDSLETLAAPEYVEAQIEIARGMVFRWKARELGEQRFAAAPPPPYSGNGHRAPAPPTEPERPAPEAEESPEVLV